MIRKILRTNKYELGNQRRLIVFGGQGTQEKGILDRVLNIPSALQEIKDFSRLLGQDFEQINNQDRQQRINKTQVTQPLLLMSHYLHAKYIFDYVPSLNDTMIGHSIGEYSALVLSNSLEIQAALQIVQERGRLMVEHSGDGDNAMLMVRFNEKNRPTVFELIENSQKLFIGTFNTPNNINVCGKKDDVSKLRTQLREEKISSILLPVSTCFHCPLLSGMVEPFAKFISKYQVKTPTLPIIRNVDCKIYQGPEDIRQGLLRHLVEPVQFWQSVQKWKKSSQQADQNNFLEIGHKEFVKKFVKETLRKMKEESF